MHRLGIERAIFRSRVRRPNHYTTEPPSRLRGFRFGNSFLEEGRRAYNGRYFSDSNFAINTATRTTVGRMTVWLQHFRASFIHHSAPIVVGRITQETKYGENRLACSPFNIRVYCSQWEYLLAREVLSETNIVTCQHRRTNLLFVSF